MEKVDKYAKIIWDYMLLNQVLEKSDLIFVLGSNDLRVAERAVEIYNQGLAPFVVCSGGNGKSSDFIETEAKLFSELMIGKGVPRDRIFLEPNSTNTGENVLFTKKLLDDKGIKVNKVIAIQKPYMERRTFATLRKQWPEVELSTTSPLLSFEEYYNSDLVFKDRFINVMVGDLLRIKEYPKLGFQIEQEIPEEVWQAGQELIKMGYNKFLLKQHAR